MGDFHQLLDDFKQIDILPVTVQLFTANTVTMYTNIELTHDLIVLQDILHNLHNQ